MSDLHCSEGMAGIWWHSSSNKLSSCAVLKLRWCAASIGCSAFELNGSTLYNLKVRVGRYYAETKQKILENIIQGCLVHADETRANIKGRAGFVWVLTNMQEVIYVLADSREGEVVQKLLVGFEGVVVSECYTA